MSSSIFCLPSPAPLFSLCKHSQNYFIFFAVFPSSSSSTSANSTLTLTKLFSVSRFFIPVHLDLNLDLQLLNELVLVVHLLLQVSDLALLRHLRQQLSYLFGVEIFASQVKFFRYFLTLICHKWNSFEIRNICLK